MARKPNPSIDNYKIMVRELRPFISFKVDLRKKPTRYQIKKIESYFEDIQPKLWTYNTVKKLPRDNRAKKVLKNMGFTKTEYKAVPLRPPPDLIKQIEFGETGEISFETKFGEYTFIGFDRKKLAKNSQKYLDEFFNRFEEKQFTQIVCGEGLYKSYDIPEETKQKTLYLMERYGGTGEAFKRWKGKDGKIKTNHYKNWLFGVNVLQVKKNQDVIKFNVKMASAKNERKKQTKAVIKQINKNRRKATKKKGR